MNLKGYGILPVLVLYMIFPLTFSIGKAGMIYCPSTFFIALRMTLSGLIMLGIHGWSNRGKWSYNSSDMLLLLQGGFFGIYLTYVPEFWALQYLSVAKSALLFVLAPFFTALFAYLHNLEIFSYKKIVGLAIGLMGFVPMLLVDTAQEGSFKHVFALNLPEVVTIISVGCYAYSWVLVKRLINEQKYSTWFINGVMMTSGGIAAGVTSFFCDGWYKGIDPVVAWGPLMWYISLITIVGMICYFLYSHLLLNFSATMLSFFGFTEPFFAAFYGWVFLSETVSWIFFVSIAVVSSGLYLFYQDELKSQKG